MRSLLGLLFVLAVTSQTVNSDTKCQVAPVSVVTEMQRQLERGAHAEMEPVQRCMSNLKDLTAIKTFLEDLNSENDDLIANSTNEMFDKAANMSLENNNIGALRMMKQVAAVRRVLYGDENVDTLEAQDWVAVIYGSMQMHYKALSIWLQVLEKRRYVLGQEHLETLNTINYVGSTLNFLSRNKESLIYLNEAVDKRTQVLGPEDVETLTSMSYKANVLEDLDRKNDSLALFKLVLEMRKKVLGEDHSDTKSTADDVERLEKADD